MQGYSSSQIVGNRMYVTNGYVHKEKSGFTHYALYSA